MNKFTNQDYKIIKEEILHDRFLQIKKMTLTHKLFNGGWSEEIERELLARKNAAAVLLYDINKDQIALIEQFRPGACGTNNSPWLFEIVAGLIDEGCDGETTAIKEAKEEANVEIKKLINIHKYFGSPGGSQGSVEIFLGLIDIDENTEGVYGLKHEHEDIKVHVINRDDAYKMLNEGKLNNAITIISLQWLQLNVEKLKKELV